MINNSLLQYPKAVVNRLVHNHQSNVALDYEDDDVKIVKLIDPSFDFDKLTLKDYDYNKPLPEPDVTHTLGLTRTFTEDEKEDIWRELQLLQSKHQYNTKTQLQTYRNKSIDLGIHLFDFEYIKGSVRAKC